MIPEIIPVDRSSVGDAEPPILCEIRRKNTTHYRVYFLDSYRDFLNRQSALAEINRITDYLAEKKANG